MSNSMLSCSIVLTSCILCGSNVMAQDEIHDSVHQVTKEQRMNMTQEQRREWWRSLSPKQRKQMEAKHHVNGSNYHKKKTDQHSHDNDHSKKHKKQSRMHKDQRHNDNHKPQ